VDCSVWMYDVCTAWIVWIAVALGATGGLWGLQQPCPAAKYALIATVRTLTAEAVGTVKTH